MIIFSYAVGLVLCAGLPISAASGAQSRSSKLVRREHHQLGNVAQPGQEKGNSFMPDVLSERQRASQCAAQPRQSFHWKTAAHQDDTISQWLGCRNATKSSQSDTVVLSNGIVLDVGDGHIPGSHHVTNLRTTKRNEEEADEEEVLLNLVMPAVVKHARASGGLVSSMELGSFWAYWSLLIAKIALKESLCVSSTMVEPNNVHMKAGQGNFLSNGYCSAESGVDAAFAQALVCAPPKDQSAGYAESIAQDDPTLTRCVNLPDLMKLRGLEHLHVLLMDMQGAEVQAVRDVPAATLSRISHILLGTHSQHGHDELLQMLTKANFEIVRKWNPDDSKDGYIYATNNASQLSAGKL